jgi:hypothetical protein
VVLPSTERSAVEGVPPGEGLFVVATRVDDRGVRNTSVEALAANASAFRGATVRVNATIAGRELGVRGLLLRRSDCGAGVVRTDAGCTVRPGTDVTLHAGVLFNGTGRDDGTERGGANDTFRYATLSNRRIVGDTAPESGRYRVTGRVVQGARVRPNGTGDALRVHRLDRIGPGDAPEPVRRRGTAYADRVSDAIAGDTGTPTPTATPTDPPTASATPTSTTTATASATPTSTTTPTASATPTPTTTPTVARPTGAEPTVTGGGLGTVPGSAPGFGALAALVALLAAVAAGRYR